MCRLRHVATFYHVTVANYSPCCEGSISTRLRFMYGAVRVSSLRVIGYTDGRLGQSRALYSPLPAKTGS